MGKVYCPFQYLLKCHILCTQVWFCRERCYQKCKRVFADNRITVSLRICRMVFVDRYPGLQRLPSSCHHHVNDTFLVGKAVCFRPRLDIFNILLLVGISCMQTEYLPRTFMLYLTRNFSHKYCIAAQWWSKADDFLCHTSSAKFVEDWREGKENNSSLYFSNQLVYHD